MLPFTLEQFLAVFATYNRAVWPAQVLAYLVGLGMVVALWRPSPTSGRTIWLGLALMWVWTGIVYHGFFFASINRAALGFAAIFVLQGVLFAHLAWRQDRLQIDSGSGPGSWLGWGLLLYAAVLYPLIGLWTGHRYPELPMFGITPCPVTLFTFGALLHARPPLPWRLLVIPFLWALVGGSAAFLLGVVQDWLLLLSSGVAVFLFVRGRRRLRAAATWPRR